MKKVIFSIIFVLMFQVSAFAEDSVIIQGYADPEKVKGVTIITAKDGKEINDNLNADDISWIDQVDVDKNGYYSISIPKNVLNDAFKSNVISDINAANRVYVSSSGNDANTGDKNKPYASLNKALTEVPDGGEIVLLSMVDIPAGSWYTFDKSVRITGSTKDCGLNMTLGKNVSVHMNFRATFENMTFNTRVPNNTTDASASKIFACGNKFVFGENLIMTNPMDVVAGHSNAAGVESTDLTIKSGTYRRIIGGGSGSPVSGDTHITIYGMNEQYSSDDDDKQNYYDSRIFGGGANGGTVGGSTYIDFKGGTAGYIVGGGNGTAVTGNTHINISGGHIMNVYGAQISNNVYTGNTNITMTGGNVEGLFGGSNAVDMVGNTNITVTGGEVTRRIYGGCYNNWEFSWRSDAKVVGNTVVMVADRVKVGRGNDGNNGIFAGSTRSDNSAEENSILIFTNDSYEQLKSMIPASGIFQSYHDFLVKCAAGINCKYKNNSTVTISSSNGTIFVNGTEFDGGDLPLTSKETNVSLTTYTINGAAPAYGENAGLNVNADITVSNMTNIPADTTVIAGVYDKETNRLLGTSLSAVDKNGDYILNIPEMKKTDGVTYEIRVFIWRMNTLKTLCDLYTMEYR